MLFLLQGAVPTTTQSPHKIWCFSRGRWAAPLCQGDQPYRYTSGVSLSRCCLRLWLAPLTVTDLLRYQGWLDILSKKRSLSSTTIEGRKPPFPSLPKRSGPVLGLYTARLSKIGRYSHRRPKSWMKIRYFLVDEDGLNNPPYTP